MKIILLILHLLPFVPMMGIVEKREIHTPAPEGTGMLLVAQCAPGVVVNVEPWGLRGAVGRDGVARISAPAQNENDDPYKIYVGGASVEMNGTLSARESLSATCP